MDTLVPLLAIQAARGGESPEVEAPGRGKEVFDVGRYLALLGGVLARVARGAHEEPEALPFAREGGPGPEYARASDAARRALVGEVDLAAGEVARRERAPGRKTTNTYIYIYIYIYVLNTIIKQQT